MLMMLCLMRMLMHVVIGLNACLTPRVLQRSGRYAGVLGRCRPSRGSRRASMNQGEALGTKMERNDGVGRSGHIAGEHGGTPVRKKQGGAWQCCLTRARQWQWRWQRGRGSSGGALGGLAWKETVRKARAESLTHDRARRGRSREERERWGGKWGRLALGVASWRPSGGVGADRRGRRRRTAAMGPPRVDWPATDETESFNSVAVDSVWTLTFVDVLLAIHSVVLAQICSNG